METNNIEVLPQPLRRQSRTGIAAFVTVGLSVGILLLYLLSLYSFLHFDPNWNLPIPLITMIVAGFGGLIGLIGLVLGVVALFRKNTKKIFAILAILGFVLVLFLLVISFLSLFIFTT